jgi:L-amino acid N-acyltransferase YncA
MTPDDADEMLRFARSLPTHDLLFLPTDITEVEGLNDWIDSILVGTAGIILAVDDGGIVGFSSVTRTPARWMRHVAELRVVVAESMRGHHLGHHLTAEAFRIAVDLGVTRVTAQMTMDQLAAIRTFRELGFTPMAILHDHVLDDDGVAYDLVLMHQEVASFDETLAHLD